MEVDMKTAAGERTRKGWLLAITLAAVAVVGLSSTACLESEPSEKVDRDATERAVLEASQKALSNGLCLTCHSQEGLSAKLVSGQEQAIDPVDGEKFVA